MSSSSEQMTLQPTWWNSLIPFSLALGENATIYARGSDPRRRISSQRATNGEVLLVGETLKKTRVSLQSRKKAMSDAVCFVHPDEDLCPLFGRS
ncbi:hypothetical protein CDAR_555861 [Caerostris darwini]|uniref:Uncharacterized protein n=1 Tax=Caerostris darwini TaxID=1538125 RepID=A0AAV4NAU8_9ARAC|nr:hypothetical protein CDAR_555861 [Caerostris darwini]